MQDQACQQFHWAKHKGGCSALPPGDLVQLKVDHSDAREAEVTKVAALLERIWHEAYPDVRSPPRSGKEHDLTRVMAPCRAWSPRWGSTFSQTQQARVTRPLTMLCSVRTAFS